MKRCSLVLALSALLGLCANSLAAGAEKNAKPARLAKEVGTVAGCTDNDGDGYGEGADCLGPDCDDTNPHAHSPTDPEICDGFDNNCNGQIDEGFTVNAPDATPYCGGGTNDGNPCNTNADCPGGGICRPLLILADLPPGKKCAAGLGICLRVGDVVCNAGHTAAICNAVAGPPDPNGEGCDLSQNPVVDPITHQCTAIDKTAATCFDHTDNDCDGITDHGGLDENNQRVDNPNCKTAELCDGFDNDNNGLVDDGFHLGEPCTVDAPAGTPQHPTPCQNTGIIVCKPDGTAGCNVSPLPPGVENTPGGSRCTDGVDNDCDGLIDLADPGCQAPEKCDGKDNDGDGIIDNGFDVGAPCSKGVGACQAFGFKVCSPDGTTTICTAVAKLPTAEIHAGNLCSDGIDNDCDGKIDAADPSCAVDTLAVSCALQSFHNYATHCHTPDDAFYEGYGEPTATATASTTPSGSAASSPGKTGPNVRPPDQSTDDSPSVSAAILAAQNDSFCERAYKVYYETIDAQPTDTVNAEIEVFDEGGSQVLTIPVENGDTVNLNHQVGVPPAFTATPPSPSQTHARFNNLNLTNTFTLLPVAGKQKLPPALYLQVLRHPEGRQVETTKIPLDCSTQLWPGTNFGSFQVVSLVSWVTPLPGKSCTGGLKALTLRYTGDGSAADFPLVDVLASLSSTLPRTMFVITGPAPLLKVTVQNAATTANAFCGAIPYLNVIKPNGEVSTGDATAIPVLAAIPQVNPHTLQIKLNGVDILAALGIDPVRDLPGGPFDGQVTIGTDQVDIKDLVIKSTPLEFVGNNMVSMSLSGLSCGGNVVVVDGDPVPDCIGHPSVLKFRYDGGGCSASQNLQCHTLYDCNGAANFSEPVRIVIHETNPSVPYHDLLFDSGSPASVYLGDSIEFNAANIVPTREVLPCDSEIKIFDDAGNLLETQIMNTSCLQPLTAGHVFGSLRVVDMESKVVITSIAHRECEEDSDLPPDFPLSAVVGPPDSSTEEYVRGVTRLSSDKKESTLRASSGPEGNVADTVPPGLPVCYVDDVRDTGTASVFKIEITKPAEGDVTSGGPTNVEGCVCHGKEIAQTDVNGFNIDVSAQTFTPGDGEGSGDLYELCFDVDVPVTNLRQGIAAGNTTGSFDPGSNLLVARAMDKNFNTTFDTLTFAVGPIIPAPPGIGGAASLGLVADGDPANFVQRAFVLGINTTGITTVFTAQKDSNSNCIKDRTKRKFKEQKPPPKKMDVECDPDVSMTINGTEFKKDSNNIELDITVSVDPNPDQIAVRMDLPPLDIQAHFGGYCQSGCVRAFGCLCAVCVTVDVDAILIRKDMNLNFVVTEQNILQLGVPKDQRQPIDFNFDVGESNPGDATKVDGSVDIGCVLGFFLDIVDFFVTVFTLGFVDVDLDILDFELTGDDLKDRFDSLDGDPMDLDLVQMKNDDEALNDFDSKQTEAKLTGCEITDGGLAISVGSSFEPKEDKIDPEARPIPGTPLKNAPVPQPPIQDFLGRDASEVTIAISDDVFNQLFYNMTQTGKLKTDFTYVRELHEFMPDDCNTIADESRRARCIGWKTQDCSAYPGRTCNAASPNPGTDCTLDTACHLCIAGTPQAGTQCSTDAGCGQVCTGGLKAGQSCTLNNDCNACSAGSVNAGQSCTLDIQCGKRCNGGSNNGNTCTLNTQCPGGSCDNSGTCNTAGTCGVVNNGCDKDGACETDGLRRSCVIGKLLAKKFNIRPDTQMILRAKIDESPKLLIDDDPQCPDGAGVGDACRTDPVEVKLHVSNLTIEMIADRNNNSVIDGDELTLPLCDFGALNTDDILDLENDPPGTIATDCLLFKHCLKVDVNFSMGVEDHNGKPRIKLDFGGIDRQNTGGYQCGGVQSLPELDIFNQRAGADGSLDQLEGNIRDNTPKIAPEGLDLGHTVAFHLDRILAIRTRPLATCAAGHCSGGFNNGGTCSSNADCEDGYQDFIGLTGHTTGTPGPNPHCDN